MKGKPIFFLILLSQVLTPLSQMPYDSKYFQQMKNNSPGKYHYEIACWLLGYPEIIHYCVDQPLLELKKLPIPERYFKAADELNLSLENSTGLTSSEILSAKTFLGESYFRIAYYYAEVAFEKGESPRKSQLGRRNLNKAIQCMDTFSVGDESQYFLVRKISFLKSYGFLWDALLTIENAKKNGIQNEAIFEIEGDIWLFLGRRSSAGLAYENWIGLMKKHHVDFAKARESHSSTLMDELNDLFDLTGHPNNLPTSWKTK